MITQTMFVPIRRVAAEVFLKISASFDLLAELD